MDVLEADEKEVGEHACTYYGAVHEQLEGDERLWADEALV